MWEWEKTRQGDEKWDRVAPTLFLFHPLHARVCEWVSFVFFFLLRDARPEPSIIFTMHTQKRDDCHHSEGHDVKSLGMVSRVGATVRHSAALGR